jgi:hypothetical protein
MARPLRRIVPDVIYHVLNRGNRPMPIFRKPGKNNRAALNFDHGSAIAGRRVSCGCAGRLTRRRRPRAFRGRIVTTASCKKIARDAEKHAQFFHLPALVIEGWSHGPMHGPGRTLVFAWPRHTQPADE